MRSKRYGEVLGDLSKFSVTCCKSSCVDDRRRSRKGQIFHKLLHVAVLQDLSHDPIMNCVGHWSKCCAQNSKCHGHVFDHRG